jgi:hypothetical protein
MKLEFHASRGYARWTSLRASSMLHTCVFVRGVCGHVELILDGTRQEFARVTVAPMGN